MSGMFDDYRDFVPSPKASRDAAQAQEERQWRADALKLLERGVSALESIRGYMENVEYHVRTKR